MSEDKHVIWHTDPKTPTRLDILERLAIAALKAWDKDWFDDNLKLDETKELEKIILELINSDADAGGRERP